MGGAHPNHTLWTIVYDISQNKVITLENFIRSRPHFLESVSRQVISELLYNPKIVDVAMLMEGARSILSNLP